MNVSDKLQHFQELDLDDRAINEYKNILKVKLLNENAKVPTKAHVSDAGYDLYSAEDHVFNEHCEGAYCSININTNNFALISTGISIAIPKGYYGRVASRSGLSIKNHVEVGAGVIDQGYRGELKVKLYCHGYGKVKIKKGDRIAQLIITRYSSPKIEVVDELDSTDRGEGGFGSTGK